MKGKLTQEPDFGHFEGADHVLADATAINLASEGRAEQGKWNALTSKGSVHD
jgi:hypothetical protein